MFKNIIIIATLAINCYYEFPTFAQSINQEISYFLKSPRLIDAVTTFRNRRAIATYYFTIKIPEDAGNSLKSVTINQQKNSEIIKFFPEKTKAFLGENKEEIISVNVSLTRNEEKNDIKIVFPESIKPGKTLIIGLRARNPLYGGIYQFGVTVYPQGNNPQPLYLGIGRIHFNSSGDYF